MLKPGNKIPDFETFDQKGRKFKTEDYKGKYLVIYFYPKDMTSGCTKEAIEFSRYLSRLEDIGVEVFGISTDSTRSHMRFAEKYNIKVRLLSDEGGEISKKFGVLKEGGKTAMRVTFFVGPDGKILHVWDKVRPVGHAEEVYKKVREILKGK
jgi:peroxiredoxin Q/BCP